MSINPRLNDIILRVLNISISSHKVAHNQETLSSLFKILYHYSVAKAIIHALRQKIYHIVLCHRSNIAYGTFLCPVDISSFL